MLSPNKDLKTHIVQKLQEFDIRGQNQYIETYPQPFRTAAVLLPLKVCSGEVFILLTKRSKSLRSHASEAAFPGGMVEETDSSYIETALREADEEIGLPPTSVEVLAVLNRGITMNKAIVYPVVGLIPNDFQPIINPSEVESAFFMPLQDFLCEDKANTNFFHLRFATYINREVTYKDSEQEVRVWGFTNFIGVFLAKIIFVDKVDYFEVFVGCPKTGRINDCAEHYFKLCYNYILADSCSKL